MRLRSESEKKKLGGKIIGACLQLEGSNWEGGRLLVGWQGAHDTFPRGYYGTPPLPPTPSPPVYLVSGRGTFLAWLAATIHLCHHHLLSTYCSSLLMPMGT